jgi:hypothetical protein
MLFERIVEKEKDVESEEELDETTHKFMTYKFSSPGTLRNEST